MVEVCSGVLHGCQEALTDSSSTLGQSFLLDRAILFDGNRGIAIVADDNISRKYWLLGLLNLLEYLA